nr:uncharacterized protein LOC127333756 [Lolium perenne]
MRTKIQELKNSGLSVVNLYNYWLARRLVPFRCRCHYMWEYTGQNDCTLDLAMEWAEADYRKALAKITMAPFTCFDAEMQLFSAEKPAPETWHEVANHLPPLAGKEPPEMIAGEEGNGEEIEEEEEETTSPPEGRATANPPSEPQPKRLRQTILEGGISLQWLLGEELRAAERVQPGVKVIPTVNARPKVLKKATPMWGAAAKKAAKRVADEAATAKKDTDEATDTEAAVTRAEATAAKKTTEAEAAKVAKTKETTETAKAKAASAAESESSKVATLAEKEQGETVQATANHVLTKEPTPPEASATGDAQKSSSTEAIVRATRLEDLLRTATQLPMAPLTFAEMHKALGNLHVQ